MSEANCAEWHGNRPEIQSPDAGTTSVTYDAAGNPQTNTDARGKIMETIRDPLNRPTEASVVRNNVGWMSETQSAEWLLTDNPRTWTESHRMTVPGRLRPFEDTPRHPSFAKIRGRARMSAVADQYPFVVGKPAAALPQ